MLRAEVHRRDHPRRRDGGYRHHGHGREPGTGSGHGDDLDLHRHHVDLHDHHVDLDRTTSTGGTSGGNTALAVSTFSSAGCTSCHTWAPAKATGKIGPNLDNISADYKAWSAKNKGKSVADFVHESIVKPDAYIAKGFSKGIMPGTFGSSLKPDQLNALVQAISSTTKSS